ncbi:MAG: FAD-dependent monooxygenase [Ramlibacter sp.]
MSRRLLIVGGGIGGLAAALAAARAGWQAQVLEQASTFSEVGAGVQLGPNATRVLRTLGVLDALRDTACAPRHLRARDAVRGHELGGLPLGPSFESRYGAPYLTVHRADLHAALLQGLTGLEVDLQAGQRLAAVQALPDGVQGVTGTGTTLGADALVGADGLWSAVRSSLVADAAPRASDHAAYRALIPVDRVAAALQEPVVTAWMGPRLHAVSYPVRGGALLNVVVVVEQVVEGSTGGWDLPGTGERLRAAMGSVCGPLQALVEAAPSWGLWVLHDRAPVAGAHEMARGRLALLGDAAHPMRPYLAQGAAMALEDALEMGRCLGAVSDRILDVEPALQRYALSRWERVARVQRRALRNGVVFHATGPLRLGRDLVLRSVGARIMDLPWLYGGR